MTNKKFYGFLIVGVLILMPDAVMADTGSTGSSYQSPADSNNSSLNTASRQSIGTGRLVTNKSAYQPQASTTLSGSTPNSGAFHRPGAFQYRKGYQRSIASRRKVKKFKHGLPGHPPSASVPELDANISQNAFALLVGGIFLLRARRRRDQ